MAKFLADWRNPVLAVAVLGTLLFGGLWISQRKPSVSAPIIVGDTIFTEQDIVKELKARAGKQIITKMVMMALIDNYARQQGVEATEGEIDQLYDFNKNQVELAGQSLDKVLKDQGISEKEFRDDLRIQALQVKMLLTQDEMQAAVQALAKSGKPPFTLPTRYRIRILTLPNEAAAKEAIDHLQGHANDAEAVASASALSANPEGIASAKRVILYAPGLTGKGNPAITQILKQLKDGQCSTPLKTPAKGMKDANTVIQLVETLPAMTPTMQNSSIVAGQYLLQSDTKKYSPKIREMEGDALDAVDVQFNSVDYDEIQEIIKDKRLQNPKLPEAPSMPGAPGGASTPAAGK